VRRLPLGLASTVLVLSLAVPAHAATVTPTVALTLDHPVTFDTRTSTVTGTVTVPGSDGTTGPLSGATVSITCYNVCAGGTYTSQNVTTDGAGRFSLPVYPSTLEGRVYAIVNATGAVTQTEGSLEFHAHSDTRITASISPDVITGDTREATLSGTLQYLGDDSVWRPLAGRSVTVSGLGVNATAVTGDDGTFSADVTLARSKTVADQVTVEWSPIAGTVDDQTFFTRTTQTMTVYSPYTPSITGFTASMGPTGVVYLTGTLAGDTSDSPVPVRIEYSADGSTGWTVVDTVTGYTSFTSNVTATSVPGYYRAEIVPKDNYYSGSVSGVAATSIAPTTITYFDAGYDTKGLFQVWGTLGPSSHHLPVQIEHSPDGVSGWTTVLTFTSGTTDFTQPIADAQPGYYRAEIPAGTFNTGSVSGVVHAPKRTTSVLGFTASVDPHAKLTIKGSVSGVTSAIPVDIQYSANGSSGWKTLTTVHDSTSNLTFSATLTVPLSTAYYRTRISDGAFYTASTSPAIKTGRTVTRITGFKVSATRVKKGKSFTISGTLQRYSGCWKALAHQNIWIKRRRQGNMICIW